MDENGSLTWHDFPSYDPLNASLIHISGKCHGATRIVGLVLESKRHINQACVATSHIRPPITAHFTLTFSKLTSSTLSTFQTTHKMISTVVIVFALLGVVAATPLLRLPSQIAGLLANSGSGFKATGATTAGAASDGDSGIAGSGLEGLGSVFAASGPAFGIGAALQSPSL